MVLESTMICVDNSEYMRNGDFLPTRMQAQQDAVNMICHSKSRQNPENNVGLLTTADSQVLVTLTADFGRLLSQLNKVAPSGESSFITSIRIAQLALKHRQGKNHKTRVVIFCGSPIIETESEIIKLAKRLKKEKIMADVINFGEDIQNADKLTAFVNTLNGKDGTNSHLVTVDSGPMLSDALMTSPVIQGADGEAATAAFEFGFDPNEDPELALALRVSMEEQRARQGGSADATPAAEAPASAATTDAATTSAESSKPSTAMETDEEALLKQALGMSMQPMDTTETDMMTEEQQIAYALQMSMAGAVGEETGEKMEVDQKAQKNDINDPDFLASVLKNLPGVDVNDPEIRDTIEQMKKEEEGEKKKEGKPEPKKE